MLRRYIIRDFIYVIRSRMRRSDPYVSKKKKIGLPIFIIVIFLLVMWSVSLFETKVMPMVLMMAENRGKVIALSAINEGIREEIVRKIKYEDLVTLKKDENERITALQINMVKMNEMQAVTSYVIQNKISTIEESELKIPLGNLFDSSILAGLGPRIKIKVIPFGSVQSEFVDEFISAGINQTKHKIILKFNASIVIIVPLSRISTEVVNSIPIAETIIVGNVPGTYLNTGNGANVDIDAAKGLAENLATQ